MRKRRRNQYHPWFRAFSGLSINISAAWFIAPFIGSNISFPKTLHDFLVLTINIALGILFLLLTVWLERKLEK